MDTIIAGLLRKVIKTKNDLRVSKEIVEDAETAANEARRAMLEHLNHGLRSPEEKRRKQFIARTKHDQNGVVTHSSYLVELYKNDDVVRRFDFDFIEEIEE